ncbi:glycine-rich domain-containing protein [Paenibacillus alkalitolerans]|uniref:hypothetical protein n=1 Tax=Paenibacillus alkalitolerans TaxID=2799335 RepID=UPI0018F713CB|nr:hypothetical protein [Paenibacillus alkalitolerans]
MSGWLSRLAGAFGLASRRELPEFPAPLRETSGLSIVSEAIRELDARLNGACRGGCLEHVKMRVLAKHPGMTDREYDWLWLELRRFFLMTAIARSVPMYNSKADDIWHEMLLFTREYESFCREFAGRTIHHEPHTAKLSKQESSSARAWFELVYFTMFTVQDVNERLLGGFGRKILPAAELRWLQDSAAEEIRSRLFVTDSADETVNRAARDVAEELHSQIAEAREHLERDRGAGARDQSFVGHYVASLLIFSMIEHDFAEEKSDGGDISMIGAADSGSGGGDSSCGGASCGGGGCGGS